MEIKVNKRIPDWISGLIAAQNLQMDRVSKYCSSIELEKNAIISLSQSYC
jgi:hypothetical protein